MSLRYTARSDPRLLPSPGITQKTEQHCGQGLWIAWRNRLDSAIVVKPVIDEVWHHERYARGQGLERTACHFSRSRRKDEHVEVAHGIARIGNVPREADLAPEAQALDQAFEFGAIGPFSEQRKACRGFPGDDDGRGPQERVMIPIRLERGERTHQEVFIDGSNALANQSGALRIHFPHIDSIRHDHDTPRLDTSREEVVTTGLGDGEDDARASPFPTRTWRA